MDDNSGNGAVMYGVVPGATAFATSMIAADIGSIALQMGLALFNAVLAMLISHAIRKKWLREKV